MRVNIVHLYPREMNIYGDTGNVLVLYKRLLWRGFEPIVHHVNTGDQIPADADLIVGGGGQDSGQQLVIEDLARKKDQLKGMVEGGVPMLMICGMYQLFGHYFLTNTGEKLAGIGVLDMVTEASDKRLIGNITIQTEFGEVVGYENHSGLTKLAKGLKPFGKCDRGEGNNGSDHSEGAVVQNVFGSYLHGPILSKNPLLADEIITRALTWRRDWSAELPPLNSDLENAAARVAKTRPR